VELLTQAADKGDANAQLNLGIMYAKGRGVGKDESKAFQLWARAAEQVQRVRERGEIELREERGG
jgi:TPR repeat protein